VIGGWLSRDSDLEATVNPGTITAIKRNVANIPVFQTNVAIYQGNSGGPAVNRDGEVIGISTWGHTNAEQIKFLVPVNVARQLLREAKVSASAGGEFNQSYRAALEAAGDGRWMEAKKKLVLAANLFPKSPDLMRFGNDADRAIRQLPPWKLYPVATLVTLFAAALLVAAATFFFVLYAPLVMIAVLSFNEAGELVDFVTSGPVVVMKLAGENAIEVVRKLMGGTHPKDADPGTIRGDWGLVILENLVHGSDGPETAAGELKLFFG